MANHVSAYLSVRNVSEEGQKVWDDYVVGTLEKNKELNSYEIHLGHFLFECNRETGEFVDWDFNQMCEEVGAKWAYATDWDECGMATYSAWGPIGGLAEKIARKIGEVDPSVQLVLTYEDEFPNFVGVCTYNKEGEDVDNTLEWDELHEIMRNNDDELAKLWDEENEEWKDEDAASDIMCDVQWDTIHEWQQDNEEWSIV
jgi:hypothetical protein